MFARLLAEFLGSFWLVFCGCGAAILASGFPEVGVGFVGVSLAFGFAYLTIASAIGHISGAHFNPALTLGLVVAGRADARGLIPYWISQLLGGVVAAGLLYLVASGAPAYLPGGFASNGYDALSPGGYGLASALIVELVLVFMFVLVVLGTSRRGAPVAVAPLAAGLALTLAHLVAIPVTNGSINPARSTATAIFAQNGAIWQLWLFWLAPLAGAALAGLVWRFVLAPGERDARPAAPR